MCSASCGGGSRTRNIFCTEENGNETTKVNKNRNWDNLNTRYSFILNPGIFLSTRSTLCSELVLTAGARGNETKTSSSERKIHRILFSSCCATRNGNSILGFSRKFNQNRRSGSVPPGLRDLWLRNILWTYYDIAAEPTITTTIT